MPTFQTHDITLNGLNVHYRVWGDPANPPVIFLHGMSNWHGVWDEIAGALEDRFHVFALDQRGHGQSDWADDYSPELMAGDLHAFVTTLGIRPFCIVGHSLGGITGWTYAARHPHMVTRLVIVDISPEVVNAENVPVLRDSLLSQEHQRFETADDVIDLIRSQNPRYSEDVVRRRALNRIRQREDGTWEWRFDARGLAQTFVRSRPEADHWADLAALQCPVLIVRGIESTIFTQDTAERMQQVIPDARLEVFDKAGHSVCYERTDDFIALLKDFLSD